METINLTQKRTFSDYLKKIESERVSGLRKKIVDYILEKARFKHINKLSKKSIDNIEEQVEDLVDEAIDFNLENIKKDDLEKIKLDEHKHFDRYEILADDDTIEIRNNLPLNHMHFDRYDLPK